jgi:hypothetical protein
MTGEPADQWPLRDFALGHEGGRGQGVDDEDVDEGYVIPDQQAVLDARKVIDVGFDADPQEPYQLPGPHLFQALSQ